jgi:C4-dicarboxylate-specific signal transduction histidine kinase
MQIEGLLDRSLAQVAAQLPNAPVQVERFYAANLPEIQADEQLCERVFVNLITNAYQAMQGQSAAQKLCVTISRETQEGRRGVGILFDDSGPGVPPELREQIFNPFFTSKKEGVGLGLSIVAKIIDDHRGFIRLENSPAKGARFHVFLPEKPEVSATSV